MKLEIISKRFYNLGIFRGKEYSNKLKSIHNYDMVINKNLP